MSAISAARRLAPKTAHVWSQPPFPKWDDDPPKNATKRQSKLSAERIFSYIRGSTTDLHAKHTDLLSAEPWRKVSHAVEERWVTYYSSKTVQERMFALLDSITDDKMKRDFCDTAFHGRTTTLDTVMAKLKLNDLADEQSKHRLTGLFITREIPAALARTHDCLKKTRLQRRCKRLREKQMRTSRNDQDACRRLRDLTSKTHRDVLEYLHTASPFHSASTAALSSSGSQGTTIALAVHGTAKDSTSRNDLPQLRQTSDRSRRFSIGGTSQDTYVATLEAAGTTRTNIGYRPVEGITSGATELQESTAPSARDPRMDLRSICLLPSYPSLLTP